MRELDMKTTQYVQQWKAIAAGDTKSIRDRWLWGLRLFRDPEAMSSGGGGLKHGVSATLIAAAAKRGEKLTERDIQWCLQLARTYGTEAEIRTVCSRFRTWSDLRQAGFPAVEKPEGAPPADHRTPEEVRHDRARQLADLADPQGALFPLSRFEPAETDLKELGDYADEQEALTARFAAHDAKRRAYLDSLVEVAGGDLSTTWQEAHDLLPDDDEPGEGSE
jgi:hypothetical protein